MASAPQPIGTLSTTPITIKVVFEGSNRKFKLPLQDLNAASFCDRIRSVLQVPENKTILLERFSDSGNAYISLDQHNPSAYKQLYRAAKAKLKIRIRATLIGEMSETMDHGISKDEQPTPPPVLEPLGSWLPRPSYSVQSKDDLPEEATSSSAAKDFGCIQARDRFFHQLSNISREREMGRRMKEAPVQIPNAAWQIFCNECDKPLADAHFHCSICDGGDYDLCETCVDAGKTCQGEGHWLIKRFIKQGRVVNSTTETLPPKIRSTADAENSVPGAFEAETKTEITEQVPSRTCNSCVRVLPEHLLCTCKDCPDFDLCVPCLSTPHGHHPSHTFEPTVSTTSIDDELAALCAPGGNMRHHATCDGCDETIYGVRHKCLNCPDWDFCNDCFTKAGSSHSGHRFVPVYTSLEVVPSPRTLHYGILCDGPLCSGKAGKAYIKGIRYKCAVCHDTDFCANCEAHPSNRHNESHPLVKFKTPVKGANITTVESKPGQPKNFMGDRMQFVPPQCRPIPPQVMAQLPGTTLPIGRGRPSPIFFDQAKAASEVNVASEPSLESQAPTPDVTELDAHFIRDSVPDGTKVIQSVDFEQSWTIRNPGPSSWPAGCSVCYIGGDKMLRLPTAEISAHQLNMTESPIEPGQEYHFKVNLRAPSRIGKHISYWRLKAPNGTPFGHKLWCDVEVVSGGFSGHGGALADYQMQLMLLEQQNKKRLMMARQEQLVAAQLAQANGTAPAPAPAIVPEADSAAPVEQTALASAQSLFVNQSIRAIQAKLGEMQKYRAEHLQLTREALSRAQAAAESPAAVHIENVAAPIAEGSTPANVEVSAAAHVKSVTAPVADVMVFPTLEKESPTSSTYQDAPSAGAAITTPQVQAEVKVEAVSEIETETETVGTSESAEERFEDLESVKYEDSDADDGFMTDEEYDILDASDEEVPNQGKSA